MKQIQVELNMKSSAARQVADIRREWDRGIYEGMMIHIYSGLSEDRYTSRVASALQDCFPEARIAGTMSAGEIKNGRLMPRGVLITALLFENTEVSVLRYDRVRGNEEAVGIQIRHDLDSIPGIRGAELLFPGTELNTKPFFRELSRCRRDIQIWGGYSGGHMLNAPVHFIFDASGVLFDSVLVTAFAGEQFHINIDKSIGWEPLGPSFHVTKAEGNRLIELNGRPASEIYEKFLQIDRRRQNNAEEGYAFPLLAKYNGEEWLRSAFHIEEDGSLNLHGFVTEGTEIQLSYGNPETILRTINKRLEMIRQFKPQAILLYSCVVRKAFWDNLVDIEMEPFALLAGTAGFHTWGEVIRSRSTHEVVEHNVTLLSIAMREGEPEDGELPVVQADDTILRGQASMLRRLTNLIYITMRELQKAHSDLQKLNEKLSVMAERDSLTGLYNRGKIDELINFALDDAEKSGENVSLIMIDIDHFKQVNDVHGHHTGDQVLQDIAKVLNSVAEASGGCAGRWGGEEFFLLLPDTGSEEAMIAAEHLRMSVAKRPLPAVDRVTISLGVITVCGKADRKMVFSNIDAALYQAKNEGRNRTVQAKIECGDKPCR